MTKTALELYMYMCSYEPIIKWLKEEGCTTKTEAIEKIKPIVNGNIRSWATCIGNGQYNVSLGGTANCVTHVMNAFKDE